MNIKVKRIYEPPADDDGVRVLVDRLWPRGVSKDRAQIDHWFRDLAPSTELRKWYGHDHAKWDEFKRRYARELEDNAETLNELSDLVRAKPVTFVFSSKEERLNNAHALAEYLRAR